MMPWRGRELQCGGPTPPPEWIRMRPPEPSPAPSSLSVPPVFRQTAFSALVGMLFLTGCSGLPWPWSNDDGSGADAAAKRPVDRIHRGTMILGGVVRSFTPCGEDRAIWVVDETDGLLGSVYQELAGGSNGAIYVEFRGVVSDVPPEQAERGYDGQVTVQTLVRAEPLAESRGCRDLRPGVDFRAWGNEPFWSVEMGPRTIVFRQPREPSTLIFPPAVPQLEKDRMVFNSTSMRDANLTIRITLEPKPCRDSMSGAYASWTSTVELLGKTYRGCAVQGWGS